MVTAALNCGYITNVTFWRRALYRDILGSVVSGRSSEEHIDTSVLVKVFPYNAWSRQAAVLHYGNDCQSADGVIT